MLRVVTVLAVLALAGCGSEARQDADEPEGTFRVEVVDASFPKRQHIAEPVEFKVSVRNADDETLRNVAVTVQAEPNGVNAPIAFGQRSMDEGLSDSGRPIWVLDEGPLGGDVANVNTWSAGTLRAGETRELTWKLVAARAGTFTIGYRVSPGLTGRAQAARGDTSGAFEVRISDRPVRARIGAGGQVLRGEAAGAGGS